jgi:hypothetical protein
MSKIRECPRTKGNPFPGEGPLGNCTICKRQRPRSFLNVAFIYPGDDVVSHTLSRAVQSVRSYSPTHMASPPQVFPQPVRRPTLPQILRRLWSTGVDAKEPSFAERIGGTVLALATTLSIRGLLATWGRFRVPATETYHGLLLLFLYLMTANQWLTPIWIRRVLLYLVYEIVSWTIFDVFFEGRIIELQGRRSNFRGFIWASYSYVVVSWIYGLYYWRSGLIVDTSGKVLPNFYSGIYFSLTTITTVGYGDYSPVKDSPQTQLLVVSEPMIGILLLVLYLGVLISHAPSTTDEHWP